MKSTFFAYVPSYPVSRYVQFIWISTGENDTTKSRVLPNGVVELILNFGNIQKTLDDKYFQTKNIFKNAWVAGMQKTPLIIQSETDTNLLGIRFKPGGAYSFFKFPLTETTGQVLETDWINTELALLREQIYDLKDNNLICNHVEQYLLKKIGGLEINKATQFVIDSLSAGSDPLSINQLIDQTGYSHKHFISIFKDQVGVSPKTLQRILRFQKVIRLAASNENLKWQDVIYKFNYYDPSHFVNDFKKLSGITPDQYLASRTFDENHCVIR